MDIVVTPTAGHQKVWTLADLLGRPLGHIRQERGPQFFIDPEARGRDNLANVNLGPHSSLDQALIALERHTRGVCQLAPDPT